MRPPPRARGVEDILVPAPGPERAGPPRRPAERFGPHVGTRAARSLRDDPTLNALAVAIICAALVVTSVFLAVAAHVEHVTARLVPGDEINLFLDPDIDAAAVADLVAAVGALDGVAGVTVVSPDEAAAILAEDLPEWRDWLGDLDDNPLPTTLVAKLADASRDDAVVDALSGFAGIDDVQSPGTYARDLATFTGRVTKVAAALIALLVATVLFIVTAVMRLALGGRAREIEVMRFLGATEAAIRAPFLIEGLAMGTVAGLLAAAVGAATNRILGPIALPTLLAGPGAAPIPWLPASALASATVLGPIVGFTGAWLAVRFGLRRDSRAS